jgi:hypothetical protein
VIPRPPHIEIQVDTWLGALLALGLILPIAIASIGGGYILGTFILGRFGRTVLGTHVRHFFVRLAPAKRFDPTDAELVELVIIDSLKRRGSRIRELLKEHLK